MTWLIWLLSGIIIGLVGGVIIDRDTVIKYIVRKIKIKKSSGISDIITIGDLKEEIRKTRKQKRQERRDLRRSGEG